PPSPTWFTRRSLTPEGGKFMNRRLRRGGLAIAAVALVLTSAACGSGFSSKNSKTQQKAGPANLQVLIASSGDAETAAGKQAAAAFASSTGNTVTVNPAQDIGQQLGQAFAGGNPPDVFYVDAARFADYASIGALYPYGNKISDASDFYQSLRNAFTYQ